MPPCCCSPAAAPPSSTPSPPSGRPRRSNPPRRRPSRQRAEPDPDRPVVELDLRLDDDLRTVTGTGTVVFTPDLPTDELVFRLVPNGPGPAAAGNRLVVDGARGDDVAGSGYEDAGAEDPGGLFVVRLAGELAAGEATEVALDFTLTLGGGGLERVGAADGVSWWASGAPLLAWEPGVGWARDPFVDLPGETATSPVADTTIRVSAPEALVVLMTGDQAGPSPPQDGRRTWTSVEPVARDVSVAVGESTTASATTADGIEVTTGVLPGADVPARGLTGWTLAAIDELEERFGPFPYATLTVPLLPVEGGGIEYPSSILLAGADRLVLLHEVAHMWFYGMVGDSQFRDPWLDEAFATYAESVASPVSGDAAARALRTPGEVGAAMDRFDSASATSASRTARAARHSWPPARPRARRPSTPPCAATSTPTPGPSPPRTTSPRRWPTCPPRSTSSPRQAPSTRTTSRSSPGPVPGGSRPGVLPR